MKTIVVRLPEPIAAEIAAESRERGVSKSDIVRERLQRGRKSIRSGELSLIKGLIGSVDELPADLSARRKLHLAASGYGRKRHR